MRQVILNRLLGIEQNDIGLANGEAHLLPNLQQMGFFKHNVRVYLHTVAEDGIPHQVAMGQAVNDLPLHMEPLALVRHLQVNADDFRADSHIGAVHRLAAGLLEIGGGKDVVVADEAGGKFGDRLGVQVGGGAGLLHQAVVEKVDDVGHHHGLVLVVGDEDGGHAKVLLDAANLHLEVAAELGVDGAEGLIQKEHLGLGDDGAGQGHTLLLAAGKLVGVLLRLVLQPHNGEDFRNLAADGILGDLLHVQAKGHVLGHAHVGEKAVLLEHHADAPVPGADVGDVLAVHGDLAAGDVLQAGKTPQQGAFAAAGGPQQGDQVALFNIHGDALQDLVLSKVLMYVLKVDISHVPLLLYLLLASFGVPALQQQHQQGDDKGGQHDDDKNSAGHGAVVLHGLVKVNLHIGGGGTRQVADKHVVAEDNAHCQQGGDDDGGKDVGHHHPEEGIQLGGSQHFSRLDEGGHMHRPHSVADALVDVGQDDHTVGPHQHQQPVGEEGGRTHIEGEDTHRQNDALDGVRDHADDLHIFFQAGEIDGGDKERQQHDDDGGGDGDDAHGDGAGHRGQKLPVGKEGDIVIQPEALRQDAGPFLEKGVNNGDGQGDEQVDHHHQHHCQRSCAFLLHLLAPPFWNRRLTALVKRIISSISTIITTDSAPPSPARMRTSPVKHPAICTGSRATLSIIRA